MSFLKRGLGSDKLCADLPLAIRYACDPRVSGARHPFAGTAQSRPRSLSLGKPAGPETDAVAHEEETLPVADPFQAGNGRWIANKSSLGCTPSVVVFPPEPPVADILPAERPAAVKGAPALGAAQRTLDSEDRSGIRGLTTGGFGGKTTFPAGEL